jgi:hypothetical protein
MADAATEAITALRGLAAEVAGLRQSLALMLEAQETHTEMLQQLLAAAAAPGAPEHELSDKLAQLAAILHHQTITLEAIRSMLLQLPQDVGQTVAQGVREALAGG